MSLHGKIKRIYCENFITYDVCRFEPGEFLNVIVGPNGSGKSTIMAAIILGLGGHPNLLGKSSQLSDYIKNGKDIARIQIELYKENLRSNNKRMLDSATFQRQFTKSEQSKWMLNGKSISKSEFLKQVTDYYIQLGNLCQLLPQERVQDFTRMNAQELFLNTITSVCKPNILTTFQMLKDMQEKCQTGKSNTKSLMQKLDEHRQRLQQLSTEVRRINCYTELQEKVSICNVKILQHEIADIEKVLEEYKQQNNDDEKEFKKLQEECHQLLTCNRGINDVKQQLDKDSKVAMDKIEEAIRQLEDIKKQIANSKNDIMKEQTKFSEDKRGRAEREMEVKSRSLILCGVQQDLKDLNQAYSEKDANSILQAIEKTKTTIKEMNKQHSNLKLQLESSRTQVDSIKRYLIALRNISEQKLLLLQEKYSDVYKGVMWLNSNQHLFAKHIYKPLLLELNIRNSDNGKYLENIIGLQNIFSFICKSKEDMAILIKELCEKQNLIVNVALMDEYTDDVFEPKIPIEQLRQYGFQSYLIDEIEGPTELLRYLCSSYNVQNIPFGSENVKDLTDEIPAEITSYFAGSFRFTVFVSEYSNEKCLMQAKIDSLGFFSCIDHKEIDLYANRLTNVVKKTDSLESQCSLIEADLQKQELVFKEQMEKVNELRSLKFKIRNKKLEVEQRENEYKKLKEQIPDIETMKKELQTNISRHIQDIVKQELEAINVLECLATNHALSELIDAKKHLIENKLHNSLLELRVTETNKSKLQSTIEKTNKSIEDLKGKCEKKAAEINVLSEKCHLTDNNSTQYTFYTNLTDDVVKLNDIICGYNGQMQCLDNNDSRALNAYDAVHKEISKLEEIISTKAKTNEDIEAEIRSIYQNWFPTIEQIITDINQNFCKLMLAVSYVGEVRLARNHEFDFQSYGIEILVKFRKEMPLQVLYKNVQSGGERSISIAAYTLAMQQLVIVPFRCVDEINQGMDPSNERKFFNMLVNTTAEENQAQYFYITPKLLSNLESHDKMTVHILFNGRVASDVFH